MVKACLYHNQSLDEAQTVGHANYHCCKKMSSVCSRLLYIKLNSMHVLIGCYL